MPENYLPVLIVIAVAIGISVVIVLFSFLVGPKRKERIKLSIYECGLDPLGGDARGKIHIKFFLVAILFIIFDLDGLSIVPWVLVVRELGWFGLFEIGVFVFFMVIALVYAIRKGAFKWE